MNKLHPIQVDRLPPEVRDMSAWPSADLGNLQVKNKQKFLNNYAAVRLFLEGASDATIRAQASLSKSRARKLLLRALLPDLDGVMAGQRAFIPFYRLKLYERVAPEEARHVRDKSGMAGMLGKLFRELPQIKESVDMYYLKKAKRGVVHESRPMIKSVHKRFIDACRACHIRSDQYPFTTRSLGIHSLSNYLRSLHDSHFEKAARSVGGEEAGRRARSNYLPLGEAIRRIYERAEIDAHLIHAIWTIVVTNTPSGMPAEIELDRIWVLVIREVCSGARLGYHLCLRPKISVDDVLACVENSVRPWMRRPLLVPGLEYHQGAGFPSGTIPGLAWAVFRELHFDREWAQLAKEVRSKLEQPPLGIQVGWGRARQPNRRPFIERLFADLERMGFERLPNTTGSHPKDPRRNDAEGAARRFRITYQQLLDLIEVMLANGNATPSETTEWRSPLEYLAYMTSKGNAQ